ncbi:hypothetical protein BDZ90DRAFT_234858 [Jaminaea rosea]|uniref:GATA-type domain-containing protein n=1 Tax=Jaminaea rosea TaxID=1569628 RepID=A0A316UHA8_9BASI|nr:hypothetical protein BDZ90DRAFT_234858 [Jaminaea rosea]PWN24580.1 hypothetical protein BDZ90DRAFT_234858 [Jaminaea rosea]
MAQGGASSSSSGHASSSSPPVARRNATESRSLEVRVWYTLESSPHRMLASSGRSIDVDLLPALEPLRSSDPKGKAPERPPRLAEVTLKTCLSAICISSPELILDRKRDYILYAVDPVETYRSSSRRSRTASGGSQEPVFRGKGFFGWILEEEGNGDTVVVGKVSEVGRRRSASWSEDDSDEYDDTAYLDVEIRMKETEAQTREQFFARLGQFGTASAAGGSGSGSGNGSRPTSSTPTPVATTSTTVKRKVRPSSKHASSSSSSRPLPVHSASSPIRKVATSTVRAAPAPSSGQAQALHVLQLLQTLQAQQQQQQQLQQAATPSAASPSAGALEALLKMTGGTAGLQRTTSTPNASSPATTTNEVASPSSLLTTALGEALKAAGIPSPAPLKPAEPKPVAKLSRSKSTSAAAASSSTSSEHVEYRRCYNCGIRQPQSSVWRLPVLLEGTKVDVPEAFSHDPHRGPNGSKSDDQDLTPNEDGIVLANGRSTWRACNRCGLFYTKWKKNRPESVNRRTREVLPGEASSPAPQAAATSSRKRPSPEADEIGETIANNNDNEEEEDATQDEILGSSPPGPSSKRTKREYDRELIKDKHGQWRSRRSVRENPEGRKSGRPQGCRSGSGKKKTDTSKRTATSEAGDEEEKETTKGQSSVTKDEEAAFDTFGNKTAASTTATQEAVAAFALGTSLPPSSHAQTSPLRAGPTRTFPWSNAPPNASTLQHTPTDLTPNRRADRYGMPADLLMSSPNTALDRLLREPFNLDFSSVAGVTQSSPIRRSPRKNPHGTRDQRNPYATTAAGGAVGTPSMVLTTSATGSPSRADVTGGNDVLDMDFFSAFTNFKSPSSVLSSSEPTSKKPSPSSQSSSQDADATERRRSLRAGGAAGGPSSGAMTSSLTSPASPSPASNKRLRAANNALLHSSSPLSARARGLDNNDDDDDEEEEDVGDSPSRAKSQRLQAGSSSSISAPICPASPSLGQRRKRDITGPSAPVAPASASSPAGILTKGPSPAPNKRGSSVTPRKQPQAGAADGDNVFALPASRQPSQSPAMRKKITSQSPRNTTSSNQLVVPGSASGGRRKPLPATVEDAPPSSAGSSPVDQDDEEEGEDQYALSPYDQASVSDLLQMFDDPYGILAANGIGLPLNQSTSTTMPNGTVATNGGGSMSVNQFDSIQLHDRQAFPQHLRAFTEEGAKGVAALAVDGWQAAANSSQQSAVTPKEEGEKKTTPTKKDGGKAVPATPTRSSPRFHTTPGGRQRPAHPPRTPSASGQAGSSSSKPTASGPPRTPLSKLSNLSPGSLAALSRSPALQKALVSHVASGSGSTPSSGGGTLDFNALFGSGVGGLGSLSPLFATPRGAGKGTGMSMGLPPLSPSLSRVLSQYGESASSATQEQGEEQNRDGAQGNELALVPGNAGAQGQPEITAADLQQLFGDDPAWVGWLGAMSGNGGDGQGQGQEQGKEAATTSS